MQKFFKTNEYFGWEKCVCVYLGFPHFKQMQVRKTGLVTYTPQDDPVILRLFLSKGIDSIVHSNPLVTS